MAALVSSRFGGLIDSRKRRCPRAPQQTSALNLNPHNSAGTMPAQAGALCTLYMPDPFDLQLRAGIGAGL